MDDARKARLQTLNAARDAQSGAGGAKGAGTPSNKAIMNALMDPALVHNALTTRSDMLNQLFDPRRDIDDECGYATILTGEMLRRMYDREIGRRVVDIYPSETWKEFPTIFEEPEPDSKTAFEESLEELSNRHHLLHYLQRIDELSGVGHYGVILWGLDDGRKLEDEVAGFEQWEETTGRPREGEAQPGETRRILYIRVLDESLVTIAGYEADVTNPRYGMPTHYNIILVDPRTQESGAVATPSQSTMMKVHWSRITHIADNRKTSEVLGTPRQEPVWNRLYDLRKVLGGSGEMFWRGGFPGLSLETQPGLENAELDEEGTRTMMFNYMNGLQRYLATTGMAVKSLTPQISDPTPSFEVQIKAICVTIGVPFRVFMGIEEGVVSGDQATKAWEVRLANRQARYVTPMIIDRVLQRLIDYGALAPTKEPMGWTVEWPDMMAPSEEDKATVASIKTEALSKYVGGGVDTLVPPMEFLTLICGLDEDVATQILESAVEHIVDIEGDGDTPGHLTPPPELDPNADPEAPPAPGQPKAPAPKGKVPPKAEPKKKPAPKP